MSGLTKEQMQERGYKELFKECYLLLQEYGQPNSTDQFWQSFVTRVNDMGEKYKESPLYPMAKQLLYGITKEIERVNTEGIA